MPIETANIIIRDGIYIHGKKIYPSKLKREPLCCLKCHQWGHKASQCVAEADICSTCGNEHRMALCEEESCRWCVSCQSPTHASWDCQCLAFISCCADYDKCNPNNLLCYFPTSEPWTHFTAPPPLTKEECYPAWWATNSSPAACPTAQRAWPAAQPSQQYTGPKQSHTVRHQRQRTLEEYQVHPAVRSKLLRTQQSTSSRAMEHLGGYSDFNQSNPLVTGTFNWADEVENIESNHVY